MKSKSVQLEKEQWAFVAGEALSMQGNDSQVLRMLVQNKMIDRALEEDMGFHPNEGRS